MKSKIGLDSIGGTHVKGSLVHQQHLEVLNHLVSASKKHPNKSKQQHVRTVLRLQVNSAKPTTRLPFLVSVCSFSWDLRGGPKSNMSTAAFESKTFTLTMQSFKLEKYMAMNIPLMLRSAYKLRIEWIFQENVKWWWVWFFPPKLSMNIAHVQPERKRLMVNLKSIQSSITLSCLFWKKFQVETATTWCWPPADKHSPWNLMILASVCVCMHEWSLSSKKEHIL